MLLAQVYRERSAGLEGNRLLEDEHRFSGLIPKARAGVGTPRGFFLAVDRKVDWSDDAIVPGLVVKHRIKRGLRQVQIGGSLRDFYTGGLGRGPGGGSFDLEFS